LFLQLLSINKHKMNIMLGNQLVVLGIFISFGSKQEIILMVGA